MHDGECGRQINGSHQAQARELFKPGVVLHRHGLAGAQQGTVQHRVVNGGRGRVRPVGVHVEAPWLDALVPGGPHEGHVGTALHIRLAGADEVTGLVLVALSALAVIPHQARQFLLDHGQALLVGAAGPHRLAQAVGDLHLRAFHRLALVQRGDPHQRVVGTGLEMHAQVGDQHAGAHIHGRVAVQQGLAQLGRFHLDHVEAGLPHGDADDLERPGMDLGIVGRQAQRLDARLAVQQAHRARLHHVGRVFVVLLFFRHRLAIALGLACRLGTLDWRRQLDAQL